MIDRAAVMKLAEGYMLVTRQFYQNHGFNRDNVLIALSAESYSIATLIHGSKGEARPFFDAALAQALTDVSRLQEANGVESRKAVKATKRKAPSRKLTKKIANKRKIVA